MITTPPSRLDGSFEKPVSAWDIGMNSKKCYGFKSYWPNPKQEKASFIFDTGRFNRISKVEEHFKRYTDLQEYNSDSELKNYVDTARTNWYERIAESPTSCGMP